MSSITILIVEDEPIVAEDIAGRLQKMGYGVVGIAESGAEAIALAISHQPNLVLMDIILEGEMDGIEAASQLRDQLGIPVVYLTANTDETTLQRAKATVPFGYILKPFKERELQVTIEIALSRYQAEKEVQQALAEARANLPQQQSLGETFTEQNRYSGLLGLAAHELRTPLSIVKVSAAILREHGGAMPEADREKNLVYIEAAVSSMNQILEDILTLSRMSYCRTEFTPEPLEVSGFCANLVQAMQWSVDDQYTLTFSTQGSCAKVWLDPKLLWHLLNNLLSNAVKYSPAGSTVSLNLACSESEICLQVQDQGIGIPLEDQTELFEPFYRARNVGSVPGTGLGLAIARHAVELHGGNLSVKSQIGQGSTFTAVLPCRTIQ